MNLIDITEANLNIDEAAERIFLGPQGRLVEKIQIFNNRYGMWEIDEEVIKITKKFKFKPGTYDRIKKAHGNYVLKYHQKPSSFYTMADRINRFQYLNRHFWEDAKDIQAMMRGLTYQNISWQENGDIVRTFWNNFIERIENEILESEKIFPNTIVFVRLDQDQLEDRDSWRGMKIYIDLINEDIEMKIYHLDEIISQYNWGKVITRWELPIWSFLNNWCEGGPQNRSGNFSYNPKAKIYPRFDGLYHPYISQHRPWPQHNDPIGNSWISSTCTGDLQSDITQSVWSLNIMPLVLNTRNWLSKYHIPNTNPLNRIRFCYHGLPKGSKQKLWQHSGDTSPRQEMDRCSWPSSYRRELAHNTERLGTIIEEKEVWNNPCNECEYRDGYTYEGLNTVEVDPCPHAVHDYIGPQTDDEAIKEACILHIMTTNIFSMFRDQFADTELIDYIITDTNRFPRDAELCNIFEYLGDNFHLEYYFDREGLSMSDTESLLDMVFGTRIWDELIDELGNILYGDNLQDDEYRQIEEEWHNATLSDLRGEIDRLLNRRAEPIHAELADGEDVFQVEEELTPEERAIRWATSRGSAINI